MRNEMDQSPRTLHVCCLLFIPALLLTMLACGTVVTDTASYICPTALPKPTATVLAGTPLPTLAPPPTPYTLKSPQEFYVGDAVFVGRQGAPLRLRFRLLNVRVQPTGTQNLVTWWLEIRNSGTVSYETVPPVLMLITRIATASGNQTGTWRTSETAMTQAGYGYQSYEPVAPGTTRIYRLAAYIPAGSASQFTYLLDGDGANRITWTNLTNPYCSGNVAG
jgi:hypothetical protein